MRRKVLNIANDVRNDVVFNVTRLGLSSTSGRIISSAMKVNNRLTLINKKCDLKWRIFKN